MKISVQDKIIDDMYPCSLFMVGSFQKFQNLKKVLCLGTAFYVSMQKQLMKQHQKCNFHFAQC